MTSLTNVSLVVPSSSWSVRSTSSMYRPEKASSCVRKRRPRLYSTTVTFPGRRQPPESETDHDGRSFVGPVGISRLEPPVAGHKRQPALGGNTPSSIASLGALTWSRCVDFIFQKTFQEKTGRRRAPQTDATRPQSCSSRRHSLSRTPNPVFRDSHPSAEFLLVTLVVAACGTTAPVSDQAMRRPDSYSSS